MIDSIRALNSSTGETVVLPLEYSDQRDLKQCMREQIKEGLIRIQLRNETNLRSLQDPYSL